MTLREFLNAVGIDVSAWPASECVPGERLDYELVVVRPGEDDYENVFDVQTEDVSSTIRVIQT